MYTYLKIYNFFALYPAYHFLGTPYSINHCIEILVFSFKFITFNLEANLLVTKETLKPLICAPQIGLYQEGVVSYDVVLGDGSLVSATADNEHSELFYALPWSHGTLGFLVALRLKIIKILVSPTLSW